MPLCYPRMEPQGRVELPLVLYESTVLPLNDCGMEPLVRVELALLPYQGSVLPLNDSGLARPTGFEPA